MTYQTIRIDKKDGVATITLNRPEKRNAMNPQMHMDIAHVLDVLRYDNESNVIVITGSEPAFCAGMDLKEFFTALKDDAAAYDRIWRLAVEWRGRTLRYYPKPTIAMVNGFCFGGAFSIVEGCDIAFASDEAVFGLSEINFKLFPGGAVSKSLANLFRPRDALFYALTGDTFTGREAAEIGFVNRSVPLNELSKLTYAVAAKIAKKDPDALQATKDGYRYSLEMTWDAAMSYSMAKEFELVQKQKDAWRSEGIGDFLKGEYRPGLEDYSSKADRQI